MRRATFALATAALLAAGCSGGARVVRKAAAATEHPAGPATHLTVSEHSDSLPGEPGGIATDRRGSIVEVDDRTVVAFDQKGEQLWSSSVPGAGLGWPWIDDHLVVMPTLTADGLGESDGHSGADDSGGCVAVDRATGARRWSYEEAGRSGVAVASAGARVFCVFGDGVVAAVDRETGALLWRVLVDKRVPAAPVTVSERSTAVVDAVSGTLSFTARWGAHWMLIVRDLSTGGGQGELDLGVKGPPSSPASIAPGSVAIGTDARVCRYDLRRWISRCLGLTVSDGFDPASVPVVADGMFVVVGRSGEVAAVDIPTWRMIWGKVLPAAVLDARPVISGGVLLFADWTRAPWAFRLSDGYRIALPEPKGFVISTATDPAGGFAVAIRADADGRVDRWVPQR